MIYGLRATLTLLGLFLLAACGQPSSTTSVNIRPGIGQEVNLNALRPPSGVTYKYVLASDRFPAPVFLTLTSRRRGETTYEYTGSRILSLPEAGNLDQLRQIVARTLKVRDINVRIEGNKIITPAKLRTDNRFRARLANFAEADTIYAPHDCFGVIGTCRYTVTEGRRRAGFIAKTTESNGIWRSEIRVDPRNRTRGQLPITREHFYSMDKNGVVLDMIQITTFRGQTSELTIRRR